MQFSRLEQQDEQDGGMVQHGEADERERGVSGAMQLAAGESGADSSGSSGVEVAVTYR